MTSKIHHTLHRVIPAVILAVGCALSFFAFYEVRQSNLHRTASELDVRSELFASEFHAKLLDFSVPVEALSMAIAVDPKLSQDDFERLAAQADSEDPVDALAWIPVQRSVADGDRMLSHALNDAASDVAWLSNKAFRTRPEIVAALRNAARDREPVALPLPAFAPSSEKALLILWPTFRGGSSGSESDFLGVTVGLYRCTELLARGLQGMPDANERISLFVGAADEAAVPAAFHARSMSGAREGRQSLGAPPPDGLRVMHAFEALGGTWRLVFDYPADVVGANTLGTAWLDLALGVLISALLAWYVWNEQRRICVVEAIVDERTRELRATSDQLHAIIGASPLPIGCVDRDCNVTMWNAAAEELFGYTAAEVLGKRYPVVADDQMERFLARFAAVAAGEKLHGADARRRCKDGTIIEVRSFAAAFHDAQGQLLGVMFCVQNMSEQNRLQRQLIQAQKMETIGQLAAGMAHEINTPIQYITDNVTFVRHCFGPVLGMAESTAEIATAWRAGELREEHIERYEASRSRMQFEYIRSNVPSAIEESLEGLRRVASIVAAMRDFSHPSGGKKAPADLGDVIRTAATVARNEWKHVADLVIDVDDDVPKLPCLRDELGQVFLNLIVNAAHAIGEAKRNTQGSIRISVRRDEDFVEVRVQDSGAGIPADVRNRVFDPFFTTKPVGQGTGQGLSICYATVVEKHGGQIDFESELGVGTTFIVRLPSVDAAVAVV